MATQIETAQREIVHVEDAHVRPMMGIEVLESLPSRSIPYSLVDPFILVHEAVVGNTPAPEGMDTTHPHRGFDNFWYAITGSSSTGHSTGPAVHSSGRASTKGRCSRSAPGGVSTTPRGSARTSAARARSARCEAFSSG